MMPGITFRPYSTSDREACLAIFDANCPAFFAVQERADYMSFLDAGPDGYEVCVAAGRVVAAFGLADDDGSGAILCWIMLDPGSQRAGIGSAIMKRVITRGRSTQSSLIRIAASHKSAPFFARFGAVAKGRSEDGWGPGLHRIDMELPL